MVDDKYPNLPFLPLNNLLPMPPTGQCQQEAGGVGKSMWDRSESNFPGREQDGEGMWARGESAQGISATLPTAQRSTLGSWGLSPLCLASLFC